MAIFHEALIKNDIQRLYFLKKNMLVTRIRRHTCFPEKNKTLLEKTLESLLTFFVCKYSPQKKRHKKGHVKKSITSSNHCGRSKKMIITV